MSPRAHQREDFSLQKFVLAHELLQVTPPRILLSGQNSIMPNELEEIIRDGIVPYCN